VKAVGLVLDRHFLARSHLFMMTLYQRFAAVPAHERKGWQKLASS
jgi:hypothetical protein